MTSPQTLESALSTIAGAAGRTAAVRFAEGRASLVLDVTGLSGGDRQSLKSEIERSLRALAGVDDVRVALTSERRERKLIAVASGKGGVGKSTVATNLAIGLARSGLGTGLVDADIYGPSQPRLMGTEGMKPTAADGKLNPVPTRFGVPMLSIGHLVAADKAIAWRGPMAGNALGQLLDAAWGDTRLLVADLPPGTGDVQLSMIAKHKPTGAIIVSTPQDLALIDARRAIDLFDQAAVPIIGIVENMAGYACPHCGEISEPFGSGGAEAAAHALGHAFLGRIPLDSAIRSASDAGDPPAAGNGPHATAFAELAAKVRHWLEK